MASPHILFRKTGLILVNGMGIIDHTYRGDDDEWLFPCLATRRGVIYRHQRIGQFRLMPRMLPISFCEVPSLGNPSRGGYGSTDSREMSDQEEKSWGWTRDLQNLRGGACA